MAVLHGVFSAPGAARRPSDRSRDRDATGTPEHLANTLTPPKELLYWYNQTLLHRLVPSEDRVCLILHWCVSSALLGRGARAMRWSVWGVKTPWRLLAEPAGEIEVDASPAMPPTALPKRRWRACRGRSEARAQFHLRPGAPVLSGSKLGIVVYLWEPCIGLADQI